MTDLGMYAAIALKVALAIFMAGSLFEMGLSLPAGRALAGFRAPLFLGYGVLYGFIVGPVLALMTARLFQLDTHYALGLMLLGLTPGAPFLPAVAKRAGGNDSAIPAMLLIAALGTLLVLPLAVPLLSTDLFVDPVRLAGPLLLFIVVPLALGMLVLAGAPLTAATLRRPVRLAAFLAVMVALVLCITVYGRGFLDAIGSGAILAQAVFLIAATAASYLFSPGLDPGWRTILVLGTGTRNVGAALAPLLSSSTIDSRAVIMVVLGIPVQILVAVGAAAWLSPRSSNDRVMRSPKP